MNLLAIAVHHHGTAAAAAVETLMLSAETVMTAPASALPALEMGEHDKTALLAVVEALVERARGIGELLERGREIGRAHV